MDFLVVDLKFMASSDVATQNPLTLFSRRFEISFMPCPYALALITGKNLEDFAISFNFLRLKSRAFRLISATVGRFNLIF